MHLSSLGLNETSYNQGKGLPTLRSLIRPLLLMHIHKIAYNWSSYHACCFGIISHKPENNDWWVKKNHKHRDFGDICMSTSWWTRKSMGRPFGGIESVDDFVVDHYGFETLNLSTSWLATIWCVDQMTHIPLKTLSMNSCSQLTATKGINNWNHTSLTTSYMYIHGRTNILEPLDCKTIYNN